MCAVFQNKSMILWNKNVTTGSHSRLIPSKLFQNSYTIHFSHAVLQWCPCFVHVLLVCLIKSFYLLNYILKQRWVLIWAPNHIMLTTDISWKARPVKNSDILKCCFSLNLHSIQWHFFFLLISLSYVSQVAWSLERWHCTSQTVNMIWAKKKKLA